ncbi:hypothetical protein AALO_G00071680 [Alosa alosa]|uniref:Uncharacterized protein n=1 Tax=Alosa alosa TaxID=278164 RepID=A0AAV6H240_9TELE|nr:hypothetical protein AALO_G00071680 [Alosa alosa]
MPWHTGMPACPYVHCVDHRRAQVPSQTGSREKVLTKPDHYHVQLTTDHIHSSPSLGLFGDALGRRHNSRAKFGNAARWLQRAPQASVHTSTRGLS